MKTYVILWHILELFLDKKRFRNKLEKNNKLFILFKKQFLKIFCYLT
jgi:hypothetical protein